MILEKETALYNENAIGDGITEAGQTADRYITEIDQSGVKVHAETNANTNYASITANGMEIFKGGDSVATFGQQSRVGKVGETRLEFSESGISAYGSDGSVYYDINALGASTSGYITWGSHTVSMNAVTTNPMIPPLSARLTASSTFGEYYSNLSSGAIFYVRIICKYGIGSSGSQPKVKTIQMMMEKGTNQTNTIPITVATNLTLSVNLTYTASQASVSVTFTKTGSSSDSIYMYYGTIQPCHYGTVLMPTYAFGKDIPDNSNSLSFSANLGTIASEYGMAIGKYNTADTSNTYPFIVGKGTANTARDNAFMIDWAGDIYPQGTKMANFVTDSGTSGSWTYRKWSGGKIEAWFSGTVTCSTTTAASPVYRSDFTLAIPSAIGFGSAPKVIVTIENRVNTVFSVQGYASTATNINGRAFRTGSSSSTYTLAVAVYVWGS